MNIHLLKRMRKFLLTTILGGLVAILPLALVFIIFRWIIGLIEKYLGPLVGLVDTTTVYQEIILYILAIIAFLTVFFFAGLIIQTRLGRFFNNTLERKYLMKIPGYKVAKDTVMQFFGKNKSFFSEVVLVDVFEVGTLMTGFVTDEFGEYQTVFVPTGPNPTSGNIYHVKKNKILKTNISVESGMKSIISCGAGSNEIFKQSEKEAEK